MEPIEGSETSAYNNQTLGKHPKEYIIDNVLVTLSEQKTVYLLHDYGASAYLFALRDGINWNNTADIRIRLRAG